MKQILVLGTGQSSAFLIAHLLEQPPAVIEAAPRAAAIMAEEVGRDVAWIRSQVEEFTSIARGYVYPPPSSTRE